MIHHLPVLLTETVEYLNIKPGGVYADLTLGLGGHAEAILGRLGPEGRLVGVDRDAEAIGRATERLAGYGDRLKVIKSEFSDAPELIRQAGIDKLDGFLMDLGVSTLQLKSPERGFSFMHDAPLDMRMDQSADLTAAGLLVELSEDELTDVILKLGEERWARAIARRVKERSAVSPITTTLELADVVKGAIPSRFWPPKTHPATRTFQALRIAVNDELGALSRALLALLEMLNPSGRAVVISYHSLEDRIVKDIFKAWAKGCTCPRDFPVCICGKSPSLKILTSRPVTPGDTETKDNPSARSAKLRAAERL